MTTTSDPASSHSFVISTAHLPEVLLMSSQSDAKPLQQRHNITDKAQQLQQALEHMLKVTDLLDSTIESHPDPKAVEFLFRPNQRLYLQLFGRPGAEERLASVEGSGISKAGSTTAHHFDPINEVKAGASMASSCLQDITVAWLSNQSRQGELQTEAKAATAQVQELQLKIQQLLRTGLAGAPERGTTCSSASCDTCGGGNTLNRSCPHCQALADHVIGRTFDDHKMLLRDRLAKAEAELVQYKSGEATSC